MSRKAEILELRRSFVPYDLAIKIQKELIEIYSKEYKPKHSKGVYYDIMIKYGVKVKERNPQDSNWSDKVFESFSVPSQHVRGFTPEHCLDQIYEAIKEKDKRIAEYNKLPKSIEEIIEKEDEIYPDKIYYYRPKYSALDSCHGKSGCFILEYIESNKKAST